MNDSDSAVECRNCRNRHRIDQELYAIHWHLPSLENPIIASGLVLLGPASRFSLSFNNQCGASTAGDHI